jgi:high-affinity iron transporter
MGKRLIAIIFLVILMTVGSISAAVAAATWGELADAMEAILNKSYNTYRAGNVEGAKAEVNQAYFGYYEKEGIERTVQAYISGRRASEVEYQFSKVKKEMSAGRPAAEVRKSLDGLIGMLREDANQLDGKKENWLGVFLSALLIILREGFEAIIVVGAIIAYLVKSGNQRQTGAVYWGSLIALGASVLMAIGLQLLTGLSGANQEIIEGVTMLIAVAVLFYVSNWMVSKAEAEAWTHYIESKVQSSISTGSIFSLAFAAFLAVFREGAETILFYQALLADTKIYIDMVWLGLIVGSLALIVVYLLIRFLSIKLPLKPFFVGTSILLFVMSISFAGGGIKELQEGDVIGVTPVPGVVSIDLLGIYPTVETLLPQVLLLVVAVLSLLYQMKKWKRTREALQAEAKS